MRCNLFKPLACKTGEFLTFAQYTDDITKEQSGKTTYMVIPSKFAVLDVDLSKVFSIIDTTTSNASKFVKASRSTTYNSSPEYSLCVFAGSDHEVKGYNNIISQIFQSAYENAVALLRDEDPNLFTDDSDEYSRYILWSILEDARFLNRTTETIGEKTTTYWPELKYVGDINFNSDRDIDNYNYNEIYCHIPADQKDKIYAIAQLQFAPRNIPENPLNYTTWLDGWNENTYPQNYPLKGYALPPVDTPTPGSMFEGYYEVRPYDLRMFSPIESPGASFIDNDSSEQFKFNTIILFYDVYDMTDGTNVNVLHRNRPMGIYFTGPVEPKDNGYPKDFLNCVTKYISNEDAYGQGASFGLRLMTRVVPTPNSSSYEIAVSTGDNVDEYNIIATSLGRISDAIKDSNESFRSMQEMAQQYKDHLANFENNRTNVPYPREVGGVYYWFVNGRNTGQRCTTEGLNPEETRDIIPNWNETGNVELILNHGEQTGWAYVEKEDINPYSATYGMLRKFREYNEEMWGPEQPPEPNWQPTTEYMHSLTNNPPESYEYNDGQGYVQGITLNISHEFNRIVRPYYEDDLLNPIYLSSGYFEFNQYDVQEGSPTRGTERRTNGFNINWQNYTPQGVFVPEQVPSGPINWEEGQKSTISIDEIEPNTSVLVVDAYGRRTGEVISKWHDINPYSPTYDKEWDVHTFDSTQYQPRLFPFDIVCQYISDTNKQQITVYRETDNTLIWSNASLNDVEIADYNYVQGIADNLVSLSLQYGELIAILVKPGENYHFNNIVLNDEISDPSYNFNDEHFGECRKVRMSIQNDNRMRITIEPGGVEPTP